MKNVPIIPPIQEPDQIDTCGYKDFSEEYFT